MKTKEQRIKETETQLIYARARLYDNDWMVRYDAQKDVERLEAKLKRMTRHN
jgi:hypothetical protein